MTILNISGKLLKMNKWQLYEQNKCIDKDKDTEKRKSIFSYVIIWVYIFYTKDQRNEWQV